ncbi:hypothetical protein Pelo_15755 [Pelomyxa schiedti]|nr:hypothetical protein Pelo_15755 [Pelomyxa schiedti]
MHKKECDTGGMLQTGAYVTNVSTIYNGNIGKCRGVECDHHLWKCEVHFDYITLDGGETMKGMCCNTKPCKFSVCKKAVNSFCDDYSLGQTIFVWYFKDDTDEVYCYLEPHVPIDWIIALVFGCIFVSFSLFLCLIAAPGALKVFKCSPAVPTPPPAPVPAP